MTQDQNGDGRAAAPPPGLHLTEGDGSSNLREQIAYAEQALREMADEVAHNGYSGTIGIEIPVDNGKLGKVKRLKIFFQQH